MEEDSGGGAVFSSVRRPASMATAGVVSSRLPSPGGLVSSASPLRSRPISLATRRGDPFLDLIARSVFTLFPRCVRCGERIERFEEAEVRILQYRVVHRGACPSAAHDGTS